MGRVNWTKHWPNKTWKATGDRLDELKEAYKKKANGIIEAHIKELAANKKNGKGSARDQADIRKFSYDLKPVTGEEGTFFPLLQQYPAQQINLKMAKTELAEV